MARSIDFKRLFFFFFFYSFFSFFRVCVFLFRLRPFSRCLSVVEERRALRRVLVRAVVELVQPPLAAPSPFLRLAHLEARPLAPVRPAQEGCLDY